MQNVQNAAEIQQRVINLVELYRRKVGKESQIAKDLAAEYKLQYGNELDFANQFQDEASIYYLNIDIPEEAINGIRANEQLLGYFYKKVTREKADEKVLNQLLADKYDSSIFTAEETEFLTVHFEEMVNYIIQTPNNDLSAVEGYDYYDIDLLPKEVLDLIKERVGIPSGSKIYYPFTGFAQLACLYQDCSFLCEESYISYHKRWNAYCDKVREKEQIVEYKAAENKLYAWMRVALYANNINSTIIEDGLIPQKYEAVISYIPFIPSAIPNNTHERDSFEQFDTETLNKLPLAYKNLTEGGKMLLILPKKVCWKKDQSYPLQGFWKQLINDGSLLEIIQLPDVMGKNSHEDYCIIIAEKGSNYTETTFIDARFASKKSDNELYNQVFDTDAYHAMLQNDGIELGTGRLRMSKHPNICINPDLLIPQVYAVETPSGSTPPLILTELCTPEISHIYDVQKNLPENTPWVTEKDLSTTFRGPINISELRKACCQNNPKGWRYGNRKISIFEGAMIGSSITPIDLRISEYRNCWYLDGTKDAVLFKFTKEGIATALINASGKAIAVNPDIYVLYSVSNIEDPFYPKTSIDALSLLALINLPLVYRQMESFQEFGLISNYGNILVPREECIIIDGKSILLNEEKAYHEQLELLNAQKTAYINEVRMRKHDMGQYIFELMNIEDLMRYYLENRETEKDYCQQIGTLLDNFRSSLSELSALLDNLSKEEQFGEPEPLDILDFLSDLEKRHKADGYKIEYIIDKKNIKDYYRMITKSTGIEKPFDESDIVIPPLYIARNDIQRMVNNILDNAKKHGFTDLNRKDYVVKIRVSIDIENCMLQLCFSNNGNPLPEGMNRMRYGIKGEKAGKTGGTGLGGNYVKSFVEHYGGNYDIFMENGWTVIRILLPIK